MGHQGNLNHKIQSIAEIDEKIVSVVKKALDEAGEAYRMLILPDHPTPICKRTHTSDPVPFVLYDSTNPTDQGIAFTEREASRSDLSITKGHELIRKLIGG